MKVIDRLPRELFIEIATHLPLEDFLSFCLVNKYMFATLRTTCTSFQYFSSLSAYLKEYPSASDSTNKFIASKIPKRLITICMPCSKIVFQVLLKSRKDCVEYKWRLAHNNNSLTQAEKFLLNSLNSFDDDVIVASPLGSALDDYYAPVLVYPTGPNTTTIKKSDIHVQLEKLAVMSETSNTGNIEKKWQWNSKCFSILKLLPFFSHFNYIYHIFDTSDLKVEKSPTIRSKSNIWGMEVIRTVEICKEGIFMLVAKGSGSNTSEINVVMSMVVSMTITYE